MTGERLLAMLYSGDYNSKPVKKILLSTRKWEYEKKFLFHLYILVFASMFLIACDKVAPLPNDQETPPVVEMTGDLAPVIDGVIEPDEWDQAVVDYFEDGSELYLLRSGEFLYLAVRAIPAQMIAGNVFLNEGDRITILHTSAALGTATFQKENTTWRKIEDFDWCCRSRIETDTVSEARADFFISEGWLGINSFLGNVNELEYQIHLPESGQSIAVNFLWADDPDRKQDWPIGLSDGVAAPAAGGFQETMDFSPDNWFLLKELP